MNHHYNKDLKHFANELRNESVSKAEKYLWKALLSRNKLGMKFKRQRPIDSFIVDFFCQEIGLIIEIDGNSHFHKPNYDAYRQKKIEMLGFTFLRFYEGEVINNIGNVHEIINHAILCLKDKSVE